MQKFKNYLIGKLQKGSGLISVPQEWQNEYAGLILDKASTIVDVQKVGQLYNVLLKKYLGSLSVAKLKEEIAERGVEGVQKTASKEVMVLAIYDEVYISFHPEKKEK